MVTFRKLLESRNNLKQRLAVYEHVVHHLEEFIPDEGYDEAEGKIETDGAGPVSLDVILEILGEVRTKYIAPISEEIARLENREVPDVKEKKKAAKGEGGQEGPAEKSGSGRKAGGKAGANSSGPRAGRGKAGSIRLRNK